MAIASVSTPVAVLVEILIAVMGVYVGYARKKVSGYFFAVTFLLFAFFDVANSIGYPEDALSVINIVAVFFALGGMYLLVTSPAETVGIRRVPHQ
jgi:hypothetical protein